MWDLQRTTLCKQLVEFKARRAREESLTFPRQAKVKPLISHLYLLVAFPLFLNAEFLGNVAVDSISYPVFA